jgi:hypothetical protein
MSVYPQTTNAVLMVRPTDFGFNPETALDNEFQHQPEHVNKQEILTEFQTAVTMLQAAGIEVLVLEKQPGSATTPDAVFPNNWFSTQPDGTVCLFPMHALNRQDEKKQYPAVELLLKNNGFKVKNVINIGSFYNETSILEGTGSVVINHTDRTVYAALSIRTHKAQLENFMETMGYKQAVVFSTASSSGKPFYHTNVVMGICNGFAVVCSQAVPDPSEKALLINSLQKTHKVIDITLEQAENYFCANLLAFSRPNKSQLIVMSESARDGFTKAQLNEMEQYSEILALPIKTIEYVGGGSARCMLAEIFLPKQP